MVEKYITVSKANGIWTVRTAGAIIAESTNALELVEGDYPPVIYFPRDDIAMAFLDASELTSHCPHKGDAEYFSIVAKSGTIADVAWSYPAPLEAAERIAGYIAFYTDRTTVEQI